MAALTAFTFPTMSCTSPHGEGALRICTTFLKFAQETILHRHSFKKNNLNINLVLQTK